MLAAERFAMRGHVQCLVHRAPHEPRRAHAVRQSRHVDHVGHLVKAAPDFADQIRMRTLEHDLAARHRTAAELVIEPHDPVMVARAVRQRLRQQEQGEPVDAVRRAVGAREHHCEIGVGVRAEPFVAVQPPHGVAVRVGVACGARRDPADVRAGCLLRHEHRALVQRVEVARCEHRQIARHQFAIAEAAQRARQRVGHADRAAQSEFRLHEQKGQCVLDERRRGVRLMAERREPELRIRDAFERDVCRILVDPLHGLTTPIAMLEHRRMFVRARRPFIELGRHARAERAKLRFEFGVVRIAEMQPQQRAEIGIDGEEIEAPAVGDIGRAGGRRVRCVVHVRLRCGRRGGVSREPVSAGRLPGADARRQSRRGDVRRFGQRRPAVDKRPIQDLFGTIDVAYRRADEENA